MNISGWSGRLTRGLLVLVSDPGSAGFQPALSATVQAVLHGPPLPNFVRTLAVTRADNLLTLTRRQYQAHFRFVVDRMSAPVSADTPARVRDGPGQRCAVMSCGNTKRNSKNKFRSSGRRIPLELRDSDLYPDARQNKEIICNECWDQVYRNRKAPTHPLPAPASQVPPPHSPAMGTPDLHVIFC
jgi:hypothetical protein